MSLNRYAAELPIIPARLETQNLKIGIVIAKFNSQITGEMLAGAQEALLEAGVETDNIHLAAVPGAFELPIAAQAMAHTRGYDAIIALGCVIRGETDHYDYVCKAAADGLLKVSLKSKLPVLFGVLTVNTFEQAHVRASRDQENKGGEIARAALETIATLRQIEAYQDGFKLSLSVGH